MGNSAIQPMLSREHLLDSFDEAQTRGVNCAALSPDQRLLAAGCDEGLVCCWALHSEQGGDEEEEEEEEGECPHRLLASLAGHEAHVTDICFLSDLALLSAAADRTLRKWDVQRAECLLVFAGHRATVTRVLCPKSMVYSASTDRTVIMWSGQSGELAKVLEGHAKAVHCMLYLAEQSRARPAQTATTLVDAIGSQILGKAAALTGSSLELGQSAKRDRLVTGSVDCTLRLWSAGSGRCIRVFRGHTGGVSCLEADRDARTLYSGASDGEVRVWRVDTGELLYSMREHRGPLVCLRNAEPYLFSGGADTLLRAWLPGNARSVRCYSRQTNTVTFVDTLHGTVICGCSDGFVRLYDAKTSAFRGRLQGQDKESFVGHFLVGSRLITYSSNDTIKCWSLSHLVPTGNS